MRRAAEPAAKERGSSKARAFSSRPSASSHRPRACWAQPFRGRSARRRSRWVPGCPRGCTPRSAAARCRVCPSFRCGSHPSPGGLRPGPGARASARSAEIGRSPFAIGGDAGAKGRKTYDRCPGRQLGPRVGEGRVERHGLLVGSNRGPAQSWPGRTPPDPRRPGRTLQVGVIRRQVLGRPLGELLLARAPRARD